MPRAIWNGDLSVEGRCELYTLQVDGDENLDAAWYYPRPKRAAEKVQGRVAFWRGVKIVPTEDERPVQKDSGFLARLLRLA